SPVPASHRQMTRSQPADASTLPSGRYAAPYTCQAWPFSDSRYWPVAASQSRMTRSLPAVATVLPSGDRARVYTAPECRHERSSLPDARLHTRTLPPRSPVKTAPPSRPTRATRVAEDVVSVFTAALLARSQTRAV